MCHAMPFSAHALKKTFSLTLILCGKKQIEMCSFSVVCTLINNEYASLLFSQAFFELFLHIKRVCKSFFHLHNAARALSNPSRCFQLSRQRFRFFDIVVKKQSECGLAWYLVLSTTIRVITVVKICCRLSRLCLVSPQHFDHCDDAYRCR